MANCPDPASCHQKTKGVVVRCGRGRGGLLLNCDLCVSVQAGKRFSVLCSSTAVISAHPIHSLDNPHHHFHSSSLASPARSHLYHPGSPWPVGTSMSLSDRANSTGERRGSSRRWKAFQKSWQAEMGKDLPCLGGFGIALGVIYLSHFCF